MNAVEEIFQKIPDFNRPKNVWTISQSSLNLKPEGAWTFDKRNIDSIDDGKVSHFISESCLEWFRKNQDLINVRDVLTLGKFGDLHQDWKPLLIVLLLLNDKSNLNAFLSKARSYIENTEPYFFGDEFLSAYNLIKTLDSNFFPEFVVDQQCLTQTKSRKIADEKCQFDHEIQSSLNSSKPLYSTLCNVFLILGDPSYSPVWKDESWNNEIMNIVGPLLPYLPDRSEIHDFPSIHSNKIISTRMLSVPDFNACEIKSSAPVFFLILENQSARSQVTRFNPAILLSVSDDQDSDFKKAIEEVSFTLARRFHAILFAHQQRPFSILKNGSGMYSLQDGISVVFRRGDPHKAEVTSDLLKGTWLSKTANKHF